MASLQEQSQVLFTRQYQLGLIQNSLFDAKLLKEAIEHLRVNDFDMPICQVLWEALTGYFTRSETIPAMAEFQLCVIEVLANKHGKYESSITQEQLPALMDVLESIYNPNATLDPTYYRSHLPTYIRNVRAAKVMAKYASNPEILTKELNRIDKALDKTFNEEITFSLLSEDSGLMDASNTKFHLSTGCTKLDSYISGGLLQGEVAMVTANSGVGKTNFMISFCVAAANQGTSSLMISLEIPNDKMKQRYIAMGSGNSADVTSRPLEQWDVDDITRGAWFLNKDHPQCDKVIFVDSTTKPMTVGAIENVIEGWKEFHRVKFGSDEACRLVCVDWITYVRPPAYLDANAKEHEVLTIVARELGFIAKRQNVVIWTANQGTREADGKAVLKMKDTAFAYHINDALDISIGVAIAGDSRVQSEEQKDVKFKTRDFNVNINKNRRGSQGLIEVHRDETLKLYDDKQSAGVIKANLLSTAQDSLAQRGIVPSIDILKNTIKPETEV